MNLDVGPAMRNVGCSSADIMRFYCELEVGKILVLFDDSNYVFKELKI